jgi:hypothetical protein
MCIAQPHDGTIAIAFDDVSDGFIKHGAATFVIESLEAESDFLGIVFLSTLNNYSEYSTDVRCVKGFWGRLSRYWWE